MLSIFIVSFKQVQNSHEDFCSFLGINVLRKTVILAYLNPNFSYYTNSAE